MFFGKRQRRVTSLTVALLFSIGALFSGAAQATSHDAPGNCSHGYWKNHLDAWEGLGIYPGDDYNSMFGESLDGDPTLLEVLNGKGGMYAAARHAVAVYLNFLAYETPPDLDGIKYILDEPDDAEAELLGFIYDCEGGQGPQGKPGEQGPQGKPGPAGADGADGAQGPQGKAGPAGRDGADGAQGPQGKAGPAGEAGEQGPQGKVGPAGADGADGAQGPQGKEGPQGPKGDKGDKGDTGETGAQGPQGKAGPAGADGQDGQDGAQGPQGKIGPKGDTGDKGDPGDSSAGTYICFSTDQTIGTQGKYVGLGTQAGLHDRVSVVIPGDVYVERLVVEASQGNNLVSGTAYLFKEGPTQEGTPINGPCIIDEAADPDGAFADENTTHCIVDYAPVCDSDYQLDLYDSLSVFIRTDNGSFEGMSACAVVRPFSDAACQ